MCSTSTQALERSTSLVTVSMRMRGRATPIRRRHALVPVSSPSEVIHRNTGLPPRTKAVCSNSMTTASGTSSLRRETRRDEDLAYAPRAKVSASSPSSMG